MKTKHLLALLITLICVACSTPEKKRITIFYTADEHGWLNDTEKADGAAALLQQWKERENYTLEADSFIVISGGDMWTGSSVSTWFKGKSMMEVLNALGYDLAALGNHEFDFSIDTLEARSKQSSFPYLAANLINIDGEVPSYVSPTTIIESNGIKVGIIGLANIKTPETANPDAVKDLQFTAYDEAIRAYAPMLKDEGAEIILIVGHICEFEMESLVPLAKEYSIPLITGGHCHSQVLKMQDSILLMESHAYLTSYIKVVLEYDSKTSTTKVLSYEAVENKFDGRDQEMTALVKNWEDKADMVLKTPIAYTENGIKRGSAIMNEIVAGSWLKMVPNSDIAIVNAGGVRQDIEAGDITMGTILGLLPFNNQITKMHFTGEQLQNFLDRRKEMHEGYIIAGLGNQVVDKHRSYSVLTTNYLYELNETQFKTLDSAPEHLPIIYREPTVEWLKTLNSNKKNPIEGILK